MQIWRIGVPALRCRSLWRWYTVPAGLDEDDLAAARKWYTSFSNDPAAAIPHSIGDVSYARSSGPGGQNVNKVNSKAQLRVPVGQLLSLLPKALHSSIRECRYYTDKSDSLLIQADDSRKQATNKDACYRKLSELVDEAFRSTVPGETSQEQREKVRDLKTLETEGRLKIKKKLSSKKANRSKSFD